MTFRPPPPRRRLEGYNPPLQISRFIGTRKGDPERGPKIWMNSAEARIRLLQSGESVWVYGPRRQELAELEIDDSIARGCLIARDVAGVAIAEIVNVVKPDLDNKPRHDRV